MTYRQALRIEDLANSLGVKIDVVKYQSVGFSVNINGSQHFDFEKAGKELEKTSHCFDYMEAVA